MQEKVKEPPIKFSPEEAWAVIADRNLSYKQYKDITSLLEQ